jgi:hypothetical protein
MTKWADYVISKVKYDRNHERIAEVEVRTDNGESISTTPQRFSRAEVVSAIIRQATFVTAYLREGKWQRGDDVGVVTVQREHFIRTDGNTARIDNLGSLPEY